MIHIRWTARWSGWEYSVTCFSDGCGFGSPKAKYSARVPEIPPGFYNGPTTPWPCLLKITGCRYEVNKRIQWDYRSSPTFGMSAEYPEYLPLLSITGTKQLKPLDTDRDRVCL